MKRVWNYLLIALCFLTPLSASIAVAQQKAPPPAVVVPTRTRTTQPAKKPTSAETSTPEAKPDREKEPAPAAEETSTEKKEPEPTPEETARLKKLTEADRLYLGGQIAAAQKLYREAKPSFAEVKDRPERKEPITDPEKLPPAGRVYWRQSGEGMEQKLESKIFVPLQFLVEQYPEFIPGHIRYAKALKEYNRDQEALQVLERASTTYPEQSDLVRANVEEQAQQEKWLEASLAARQFALLNPNDPAASEFAALADKHLERYKQHIRAKIRGNTIANIITGAVGYALTGNLFGPISAVDSTVLLLRGESAVGQSVSNQAKRQLKLVEDPEVVNYVRELGDKLATVAGRNDFKYEFNVVLDDKLNAFALPGGKVFVNAGAIAKIDSEAELAGLMAHELSHAVLSHGFQLVTQGNLTANVTQFIPYGGGLLGNLLVSSYSRDMERQADTVGTRILASTGYAADGMRNLMVKLDKEDKNRPVLSWLASHPVTDDRVRYLEELIQTNGYNRYAYEGVARHAEAKVKVKKLLAQQKKRKEANQRQRNRNQPPIVDFQLRS